MSSAEAQNSPLQKQINAFLAWVSATRSSQTLRAYSSDLQQLHEAVGGDLPLTQDKLKTYLKKVKGSTSTRARKLSCLRSFCEFLLAAKAQESDPTIGLESPIQRKRIPKTLSQHQAEELLDQVAQTKAPLRDRAVLELLYSAGLRASEVVSALRNDLNLTDRTLQVRGKGNKDRIVIFGGPCAQALTAYLTLERVPAKAQGLNEPLLTNPSGKNLTTRTVQNIVKRWATQAGLPETASPHTLRHSFATHMLDGGAEIKTVQQLLGHESLSTTQIYTEISVERLREAVLKAHPKSKS